LTEEELAQRMKEFVLESTEDLGINNVSAEQEFNDMMLSQEYLREEREQEQWDCETILTTYSTLDNHPSVIQVRH
jgi:protein LTV1